MEADQLPGYTGNKRTMADTLCDCEVAVCCGFTLIAFLFLSAWSAMVHEIPQDQFSQAMFPYLIATCVGIILWLIYKVYTKSTRK